MNDAELKAAVEQLQAIMVSVSTGGPRIDDVNFEFQQLYDQVDLELGNRKISNPLAPPTSNA